MARYLSDEAIQQKKQTILNAALAVFVRKGYGQSTIPDIAYEAGISVGSIYNYFVSKQALLIELMHSRFFTDPLARLLEDVCTGDEEAFLHALYTDRIKFGIDNFETFLFLFSEVQRNSEVREEYLEQILRPMLGKIQTFIESGTFSGKFKQEDPALVARAIAGMAIGFILLYSVEREKSPVMKNEPRILADTMTRLILNGLRKRPESATC